MDSAIRSLRDGGFLALTATDLAPLCGVHPRACLRKYGGKPLRTEYSHELAVRLAMGCLTMTAAKHEVGIHSAFSHSTDHYIRVYALADHGARRADNSIREMGYILHCFACFHREASRGITSHLTRECPECGATLNAAGPLWLGKISDEIFCSIMENEVDGRSLRQEKRIRKLLYLIQKEAEGPATYYVTDKICDKLNLPTPPLAQVLEELKRKGFQAIPTHFHSQGVRTDAPSRAVKGVITELAGA